MALEKAVSPGPRRHDFLARDVRRDVEVVDVSQIETGMISARLRTWNVLYAAKGIVPQPAFGDVRKIEIKDLWIMAGSVPWQPHLREALAVLALPADEQVSVNGPGCVACDLLNDFDHARIVALGNAPLSEEQRRILDAIDNVMRSMEKPDFECFNNDVLLRPAWQRLRELAADALRDFAWASTLVEPFVEIEPGVWRRER